MIKDYCQVDNIYTSLMFDSNNRTLVNCDILIMPQHYFYPYTWENITYLFKKNNEISIKQLIDTYSIHFYGKLSQHILTRPGDNSIYDYFAKLNCPFSYEFLD